jgi:hypothetical protein
MDETSAKNLDSLSSLVTFFIAHFFENFAVKHAAACGQRTQLMILFRCDFGKRREFLDA